MRLQWEYHVESVPMANLQEILGLMGADGWELVHAQMGQLSAQGKVMSREQPGPIAAIFLVLKRPKVTTAVSVDYGAGEDASQSVTVGLGLDVEAN